MKRFYFSYISEYKFLFIISFVNFLLVYLSTFTKGYGYFIDEFYYIACAVRPAFGYVDHPPLAPLVLTAFQFLFGSSMLSIRILPALAESASVFFTGILTKEIGGGKFSQSLAAICIAACPVIVTFGGFYSMNAYEPLLSVLFLIFAVKMIKENNPGRWILLGIIMGLGLMNKHTFSAFIIAVVLSLLVSGKWKLVLNKWFAAGSAIALLIFLPNIIWEMLNSYPTLEFYRNISSHKNIYTPPLDFLKKQIIDMSPATFPFWVSGAVFLLFSKKVKEYRFLSMLFISLFLIMMLSGNSRPDRLAFVFPAAFAGGAFFFEQVILKYNLKWLKPVLMIFLYAGILITLPIILPYFSYEEVKTYTKLLGLNTEIESGNKPPLPQLLADRIGWEDKFKLVLNAYQSLSDKDKKESIIAAGNYGQAGAIELYGKKYNLPTVVCGHNTYYLWSKDKLHGSIVIELANAGEINGLKNSFDDVTEYPGEYTSPYVTSHENHLKVFICRKPKLPLAELLDRGRFYY